MHHKKFDRFSSLWNYCIFCPICKKDCRDVEIKFLAHPTRATNNIRTLYPSKIKNFKFTENNSTLKMCISERTSHEVYEYLINIDSLTESVLISKKNENNPDKNQLSFYVYGFCTNCLSYTSSGNIKTDSKRKNFSNLYLESEGFYLTKSSDKYFLFVDYVIESIQISKIFIDHNKNITVDFKEYETPLFKIDLENQDNLVKKIKTILTFI
jgi:hypothetical protein